MDIKALAQETIIALKIVPDEQVVLDVLTVDWNGTPEVRIASEPSKPEDETQFGAFTETTIMGVHVLAVPREVAQAMKKQAADAVYARFEELEQTRGSGILCITPIEHNTVQISGSTAFHSFTNFQVLHSPTL